MAVAVLSSVRMPPPWAVKLELVAMVPAPETVNALVALAFGSQPEMAPATPDTPTVVAPV